MSRDQKFFDMYSLVIGIIGALDPYLHRQNPGMGDTFCAQLPQSEQLAQIFWS